jgi:rhamnosyltransferase
VTYHPDLATLRTVLEATVPQVDRLLVVDNGSPEALEEGLRSFIDTGKVGVHRLGRNFGIAYAHNRGLETLLNDGCDGLLILDQDSVPQPAMVAGLRNATAAARAAGVAVSAAGPRYVDPRTGH